MLGYVVKRFGSMLVMLAGLSVMVFLLFSVLPADPARLTCGKTCTPDVVEANRQRLGLDKPLVEQYAVWAKGIVAGRTFNEGQGAAEFTCPAPCLGYSFSQQENVTDLITEAVPVTIWLAAGAFVLWMTFGLTTGVIAALNRGRWPDVVLQGISLVAYSLPSFFVGLMLLILLIVQMSLLPYPDYYPPSEDLKKFLVTMVLPWVTVAFTSAAFYTRLTRTQMVETMGEDYIRTARAKGLAERTVTVKHALRAGLTPIVTAAGLDLGILLGGAIITEQIFNLPGMGRLAVESVVDSDLPVITGITLVAATFIIVANFVVDMLYMVIDPRVRLA
ncbi:MAG: ABC transporter permease [Kineosporiaceae bacterium]|nr:ABC transporter permease [Kineosporiaceae bacterium]